MYIKRILFVLLAAVCSFGAQAQRFKKVIGDDNYEWREFKVADFNKFNISEAFNITYKVNPDSAGVIRVYGEQNILDMLVLKSEKGKVNIKLKGSITPEYGIVNVVAYSSSLTEIDNQGAATFEILTPIHGSEIKFTVVGAGMIKAKYIDCGVMKVNVGGSGDVIIEKGKAGFADYSIQGKGDITAEEVVAEEISATITGSGTITCNAEKNLKTFLTGSGKVKYKGDPDLKTRTVGSGSVLPLQ